MTWSSNAYFLYTINMRFQLKPFIYYFHFPLLLSQVALIQSKNHTASKRKLAGKYQFDTYPTGIGFSTFTWDQKWAHWKLLTLIGQGFWMLLESGGEGWISPHLLDHLKTPPRPNRVKQKNYWNWSLIHHASKNIN